MQVLKANQDFSAARLSASMSISDVADFLNISALDVERLERGDCSPSVQQVAALKIMFSLNQKTESKTAHKTKLDLLTLKPIQPNPRKVELAQFFTSQTISNFMAEMFDQTSHKISLLDAGAGEGALSNAFIKRWAASALISGEAHEIDEVTFDRLNAALTAASIGSHHNITAIRSDFIAWATAELARGNGKRFTHAILNPPYKKISSTSPHRLMLRSVGLETVNLYSGFVAMAVAMTKDNGEVVAIIPRSFCNGPYYIGFRKIILEKCAIEAMHIFERRDSAFSSDGVLQENVIIKLRVGAKAGPVKVSESCDESFSNLRERFVKFSEIVRPDDPDLFIHIPLDGVLESPAKQRFQTPLSELGIECSTGPVVDFRLSRHLSKEPRSNYVPLLYPQHFNGARLFWPTPNPKKANAIELCTATAKQLLPKGHYVVVRRFSSKEEKWRINPGIVDPSALVGNYIGIENHLNYFHSGKRPLEVELCWGITAYLSSTLVDTEFRKFSGHTQVNSTDLRKLRYPSHAILLELGSRFLKIGTIERHQVDSFLENI